MTTAWLTVRSLLWAILLPGLIAGYVPWLSPVDPPRHRQVERWIPRFPSRGTPR